MKHELALHGLIPPMITPLTLQGAIDLAGVEKLVEFLIANGVSGLFLLGSSGEGPWLRAEDSRLLLKETVRVVAGRVPVLAGVLETGTRRTIGAIQQAADCGVDAVVATTPYYFETSQDLLIHHFEAIIDQSPVPIVLYNIPSKTHMALTPVLVRHLVQNPKIIGLKDSAGDPGMFREFLAIAETAPHFSVFQGAEHLAGEAALAGADGLVVGMGNLVPGLFIRLLEAAQAGDYGHVAALQADIDALWQLHTYGFWLECLKYAVSLNGLTTAVTYAPNNGLSDEGRAAIHALVTQCMHFESSPSRQ